jgi:hypothetical protein
LLVKDNVALRLPFARMLELEPAPELDVGFAQADSLAETHALPREEDGLDAALTSVEMPDGAGLEPRARLRRGRGLHRLRQEQLPLERVMNSIRNGLGMGKTEIAKEPSRPWNPHFYAVFAQVHNTL